MSHFGRLFWQGFIVVGASGIGIKPEIELVFPTEFKPRFRKRVIAQLRTGMPFRQIGSVSCDLIGDDAFLHIILVGQSQVLFRSNVTQHGAAVPTNHGCTDTGRNVIVTGRNIGG